MLLISLPPKRKFIATVLTFWIPVKSYRRAIRSILYMGLKEYKENKRFESENNFKYKLSIAAIMKNESAYLAEWIEFHKLVGVEKFYLYDNESTDNTHEVLSPYIESGLVEYIYFPGIGAQNWAYCDVITKKKNETKWLALIDIDEFIVPVKFETITEFIDTLPKNSAQLVISWVLYGSAGNIKKPDGLVIENYKYRGIKNWGIKSIVNPRLVIDQNNPHANEVAGFTVDENGSKLGRIDQTGNPPSFNKIRCNHYITKSFDEFQQRCAKGSASTGPNSEHKKWSLEKFDRNNINDVYDDIMDKYIQIIKNKIN